ncbi:MAG: adenylate/guanylate cyclase domain-containing protein [Deltaproteobacteria bacterium]|nr:adenylate/guanylate cyclase domain-containing protein [Deltaproteobacteria bacterium]
MSEREFVVESSRVMSASSDVVWALVSDTNRVDRAVGLSSGEYRYELLDPSDPSSRERVAEARELGLRVRWVEPPYEWVEGRSVRGERRFLEGPVSRGGFEVSLLAQGDRTEVRTRLYVKTSNVLGKLGLLFRQGTMKRNCERYLESIDGTLGVLKRQLAARDASAEPAAAFVRRALYDTKLAPIAAGPSSAVNEVELMERARVFESAPVSAEIRAKLLGFLRERADDELSPIRPFELCATWKSARREVLRTFLYAARAGLVDLRWQLNCPTCRVGAQNVESLSSVKNTAHCEACNIDFGLDFSKHVEAVFVPNPAVRRVESAVFCASSPWFKPHVFAQVRVEPHSERVLSAPLPDGELLVRTLEGNRRAFVELTARPDALSVTVSTSEFTVESSQSTGSDDTVLTLRNDTDRAHYVLFERAGWNADIVLGSAIASMPEFLDLFATEAPASGVELSVSALTLMFTDLTGSTAMYERLGDARAFALVQEHFAIVIDAIGRHGGAVIKTMGDAVMANFVTPVDALRASLEMAALCDRAHHKDGLSIKIGFHQGPCLVVRANDRLDYFGTTVNVAARLQAQAHANEIVLTSALSKHPEIAAILSEQGWPMSEFDASLKGIAAMQRLVRVDATPRTDG